MEKQLQELFSLPIGLKVAAIIDGQKFFSSEKLQQSFVKAFEKSGRGKPVANDILKMVEKGSITPCYLHKGLVKFMLHRTFGGANKAIMGFYHKKIKKVYVLIDNNISVFGVGSSDLLVSTTMHECMHLLAGTKRSTFLSIFNDILLKYYSNALQNIFHIKKINPASVKKIFTYLMKFENAKDFDINKGLSDYFKLLESELKSQSELDETKFRRMLTDYIVSLKLLLTNFSVFIKVARKYLHILTPLSRAYQQSFGIKNIYTTPIQELIYPSEIACVYSEMKPTSSAIKKAFKALS